jgi:hypothetical protein
VGLEVLPSGRRQRRNLRPAIPAVNRGAIEAYIQTASHQGRTPAQLATLTAPWLTSEGQAAFYRQIAEVDEKHTVDRIRQEGRAFESFLSWDSFAGIKPSYGTREVLVIAYGNVPWRKRQFAGPWKLDKLPWFP